MNKRKTLTAAVLVALTVILFTGTALAATVFLDQFTRSDSSTVGNGWVEDETAGNDAKIDNNDLLFETDGDEMGILVYKDFTDHTSGLVEMETTLNLNRTGTDGTYHFHIQLGDSSKFSTTNPAAGVVADLVWEKEGGYHEAFAYYDGSSDELLCTADGNIEVRIVADLDNEDWYVDVLDTSTNPPAHCTQDGIAFRTNQDTIDAVRFIADDFRPAHFDDIIVKSIWVGDQ